VSDGSLASFTSLALLVMVGWAEFGWEDAYKTRPVDEIVYLVCLVGSAACAGLAFRSARGCKRYGWLALKWMATCTPQMPRGDLALHP
jgi:hypothetical protein